MDDAQLRTVWQQRQFSDRGAPIGQPLAYLMKHVLARRVRQLGQLACVWDDCVPQPLRDHTALESFQQGVLTVMVDSSAHRFLLQTLLNGDLTGQIRSGFPGPLNKIRLVPGRFYSVDVAGAARYEF